MGGKERRKTTPTNREEGERERGCVCGGGKYEIVGDGVCGGDGDDGVSGGVGGYVGGGDW